MVIKSQPKFENLELGRANKHAFIFGSGPAVVKSDERRGLILAENRREYMFDFCTLMAKRADNISTKRPQILPLANTLTQELLKAGGVSQSSISLGSSVYSYEELIKYAFPKWRHTNETVRMHYHQKAMRTLSEETGYTCYSLTMLLSPEMAKQVINKGGCTYLLSRLSLKLKRKLNRTPLIWLILEGIKTEKGDDIQRVGKGRIDRSEGLLHVHGAIALKSGETSILKRVVRDLNGSNNDKFNNQELRIKLINDDVRWVEYCNKHRFLNLMFLNGLVRYSRSKKLGGVAERLYLIDQSNNREISASQ